MAHKIQALGKLLNEFSHPPPQSLGGGRYYCPQSPGGPVGKLGFESMQSGHALGHTVIQPLLASFHYNWNPHYKNSKENSVLSLEFCYYCRCISRCRRFNQ